MKLTRKNVVRVLTDIQDNGDFNANVIATQAVEDFGLEKEHKEYQKELAKFNRTPVYKD